MGYALVDLNDDNVPEVLPVVAVQLPKSPNEAGEFFVLHPLHSYPKALSDILAQPGVTFLGMSDDRSDGAPMRLHESGSFGRKVLRWIQVVGKSKLAQELRPVAVKFVRKKLGV